MCEDTAGVDDAMGWDTLSGDGTDVVTDEELPGRYALRPPVPMECGHTPREHVDEWHPESERASADGSRVETDTAGYVRRVRRMLGVSQRELAERLQVSPATVGRWESGAQGMQLSQLDRVLALAGLRLQVVGAVDGESAGSLGGERAGSLGGESVGAVGEESAGSLGWGSDAAWGREVDQPVAPMGSAETVRDRGGRFFPAHLDILPYYSDALRADGRGLQSSAGVAVSVGRRGRGRPWRPALSPVEDGRTSSHPTVAGVERAVEGWRREVRALRRDRMESLIRRRPRVPEPEPCSCPMSCERACLADCPCQCEPSDLWELAPTA